MPLQNRVDPFGAIHAVTARGIFTGNRGVIHDPRTRTLLKRRWTTKAWIICACAFNGRHRTVMGRNSPSGTAGWTELFFLDEVTALAAGHRPCFHCRREAASQFATAFACGQGRDRIAAAEIDAILHRQRLGSGATPTPLSRTEVKALPEGAVIAVGGLAFARRDNRFLPWSFGGYGEGSSRYHSPPSGAVLLTPPGTVAALRHGFAPIWAGQPGALAVSRHSRLDCATDGTSGKS